MAGPVVADAKAALASGNVTPVLKWVGPDHEAEIREAFDRTETVRALSPDARQLADKYFFETLVRLHREGEGAPYTGVKDEPVEPVIAMAEASITSGSPDDMIGKFNNHMAAGIREKFAQVAGARKQANDNVDAGRAYVAAYVAYMHYVEAMHAAIVSAGGHAEGHQEGEK